MTPTDPTPPPMATPAAETKPMNEFERLAGVFFSPGKAFADIARNPRWWVPIILSSIVSFFFLTAFGNRVGWEEMMRQQLDRSSQAQQMTLEQREQVIRVQSQVLKYTQYASPVIAVIFTLLIAVVFLFLFDTLQGADIGLKRYMAIAAYGGLPLLIYNLLAWGMLYLKAPEDYDLNSPLAFNIGAFLPADSSAWMRALGQRFDLFTFWCIILMAIGVSAASRKISTGKAVATILFPWLLYVALITAVAAAFG